MIGNHGREEISLLPFAHQVLNCSLQFVRDYFSLEDLKRRDYAVLDLLSGCLVREVIQLALDDYLFSQIYASLE